MSFVSLTFLALCAVTLLLYHLFFRHFRVQNVIILAASWACYGWANIYWLVLLIGLTAFNYVVAIAIERAAGGARKRWLTLGIVVDLSALFVYKYFDFFSANVAAALSLVGVSVDPIILALALPIGISFHIFQLIGYLVDVHRGELLARRDPLVFACFVAFFPQVAAGPIERGSALLPQFERRRMLDPQRLLESIWLILWGSYMKIVVADPLGPIVADGFDGGTANGATLAVAVVAFTVQIYADFCGYSLMAKGISGLFGIELSWNFDRPYIATSIQEFWRRWHMTLSRWLRDYVYIPLGGNRGSIARTQFNLIATMALAGLWHGAAWNFILWGLLHGAALATARAFKASGARLPFAAFIGWAATMAVVMIGWLVFRAGDVAVFRRLDTFSFEAAHGAELVFILLVALPVIAREALQTAAGTRFPELSLRRPTTIATMIPIMVAIAIMAGQFRFNFIYFQF